MLKLGWMDCRGCVTLKPICIIISQCFWPDLCRLAYNWLVIVSPLASIRNLNKWTANGFVSVVGVCLRLCDGNWRSCARYKRLWERSPVNWHSAPWTLVSAPVDVWPVARAGMCSSNSTVPYVKTATHRVTCCSYSCSRCCMCVCVACSSCLPQEDRVNHHCTYSTHLCLHKPAMLHFLR